MATIRLSQVNGDKHPLATTHYNIVTQHYNNFIYSPFDNKKIQIWI